MPRQRGFSLIEALIALAMLAFGLIGVAAMQLKALQSTSAGYQRTLANVAAIDAQERVWGALAHSDTCSEIALGALEAAWQAQWFADSALAVLPHEQPTQNTIVAVGCRFTVTVHLAATPDDDAAALVYEFRLPIQP